MMFTMTLSSKGGDLMFLRTLISDQHMFLEDPGKSLENPNILFVNFCHRDKNGFYVVLNSPGKWEKK